MVRRIPVYRQLARTLPELEQAANTLAEQIAAALAGGGGAHRGGPFGGGRWVVAGVAAADAGVVVRPSGVLVEALAEGLRRRDVPIICRLRDAAAVMIRGRSPRMTRSRFQGRLSEVVRELAEA